MQGKELTPSRNISDAEISSATDAAVAKIDEFKRTLAEVSEAPNE